MDYLKLAELARIKIEFDDYGEIRVCEAPGGSIIKFAELIVQRILGRLETERDYYAKPDAYQFLEYYTKMSAKEDALNDAISMIRNDFGIK